MENLLHGRGKKSGCQVDALAYRGRVVGVGGIMSLWKDEGKEKWVAQKDGSKGSAYRLTPQRL